MRKSFGGKALDVGARFVVPFSIMYAVYVLAAGESSPGGGFQAGAVLALSSIFAQLIKGKDAMFRIPYTMAVAFAGLGTFIYVLTGWLTLFFGGQFLEYGKLPFAWLDYEQLHALGIFMIEAGVTICVMMTINTILDALLKREDFEDD